MWLGRFILFVLKPVFWLLFPYKTVGKKNIPPAKDGMRIIMCSNHISDIDPVFILEAQRRPVYYMAKSELFPNKLATWFFSTVFGAFPVQRGKGDSGAIDKSVQLVHDGKMMGIFPEGTRSRDGSLGRAKSGAALIASASGAHILPVAILTKSQKVKLFRKTTIIFGEPMSPTELHLDDAEKPDLRYASRRIMERIGELMEEAS